MFEQYNLDERIIRGIQEAGFIQPMPIQNEVIPLAILGKDLMAQSQTGTGKTAAFLVSLFQQMLQPRSNNRTQALVIAPTRELAVQIEKEAIMLSKHLPFTTGCFYGGVGYNQQEKWLKENVDILIGTPGRLLDLAGQDKLKMNNIAYLVIDEADRLFDMGFYPDIRKILGKIGHYKERQTMLFSATLDMAAQRIARDFMNHPVYIAIDSETITVDTVNQSLYHVSRNEKIRLLIGLLRRHLPNNALIFTNTRQGAQMISRQLQRNGFKCHHLSGELAQNKRLEVTEQFKSGDLPILVATDVAARGLHIEALEWVVNYDLPADPESYVHRIGRTARAGKSGQAISLVCETYVYHLEAIEQYIGQKITVDYPEEDLFATSLIMDDGSERRERSDVRPKQHRAKKNPPPQELNKKRHRPLESQTKKHSDPVIVNKKKAPSVSTHIKATTPDKSQPLKTINHAAEQKSTKKKTRPLSQAVPQKIEDRLAYYQKKYGDQFNIVNGVAHKPEKKSFFKKIVRLFKNKN